MGVNSLLQNMAAASTELKRSEKLLKNAKQQATTLLKRYAGGDRTKIENYRKRQVTNKAHSNA
jgi:hypothetical protein